MERWVVSDASQSAVHLTDHSVASLRKLKEKLHSQRKYLDELDTHIKELEKEQGGGEQH
jgi:Mitochondrial ATPase inhibitor, IATP